MPGANNIFLDSNILLYALGIDAKKREIAWKLLLCRPSISLQVINECSNVLQRKQQWKLEKLVETLEHIVCFTDIGSCDLDTVRLAWRLQMRYRYSYYDSLIIATALVNSCSTLYSEDMQTGQVIEGQLSIINPFI